MGNLLKKNLQTIFFRKLLLNSINSIYFLGIFSVSLAAQSHTSNPEPRATPPFYTIEGEVWYNEIAPIYVALITELEFPFPGSESPFQMLFPDPLSPQEKKRAPFQFTGIPKGEYALVAFQDRNRNGILDRGIFGPTEPWDMSFAAKRPRFRAPRFQDASFRVPEDNRYFILNLE